MRSAQCQGINRKTTNTLMNGSPNYKGSKCSEIHANRFGKSWLCVKSSNSGDILKFITPNFVGNNDSGWTNYSGMVIANKMNESEMDYRGSKSEILFGNDIFVKEQRVDGDYYWITCAKYYSIIKVYSNGWWKSISNQNPF